MPHYILVKFEDDSFPGGAKAAPKAHEHVVHALHGHVRALGITPLHSEVIPIWLGKGQRLDNPDEIKLHTLAPDERIHLISPPDHTLVFQQYHDPEGNAHIEASCQTHDDYLAENGMSSRFASPHPKDVPDSVTASWPQHEPQQ